MGHVTFDLTQAENAELAKAVNGQGGYQTLLREIRPLVQPNGSLTIDDEQLGRIVRMCAYGSGGFQGRLRKAFKSHVRSLMAW